MSSSAPPPAVPKSALDSAAAAAGTNWLLPPPPPSPPSRLPRNWTLSAMISTAWRLVPSCASDSRQSRRPSIATGRPLARNCAHDSPWLPQIVTLEYFGLPPHSALLCSLCCVIHALLRL